MLASGASWRSPGPFIERSGRRASGQICRLTSTDHRIPSNSCSNMPSPFEQLEAMSASWQTGSGWLQRTSPGSGSWFAAGIHLVLERSLRALPRQVRSPWAGARGHVGTRRSWWLHLWGAQRKGWGLGSFVFPPSAEKKGFSSS
jgi:hypothetical protein